MNPEMRGRTFLKSGCTAVLALAAGPLDSVGATDGNAPVGGSRNRPIARRANLFASGVAAVSAFLFVSSVQAPAIRAQAAQAPPLVRDSGAPEFEVASVKAAKQAFPLDDTTIAMVDAVKGPNRMHGRMKLPPFPLEWLIMMAYDVRDFQVVGGPAWIKTDCFEVIAKAEDRNANFERMRPMLQSLLITRFHLTLHPEDREMPIYELAVARRGLKIEASKHGSCAPFDPNLPLPGRDPRHPAPLTVCGGWRRVMSAIPDRGERIEGLSISMPRFIDILSQQLHRPIVDKTGFTKQFDFKLDFAPDRTSVGSFPTSAAESGTTAVAGGISIFTALQEQLGLRLESAKGPVQVLVIDHVEKPVAN